MDIRDLRYFVETVRYNSFSRAADALHVTQSAVSKKVAQLEEKIGSPLLVKQGRQIGLTDVGRVVYERAQEVMATMSLLGAEIAGIRNLDKGVLTIGIPPMINSLFTGVLKQFRLRYPDIRLVIVEAPGPEVEKGVAEGRLELGMTLLPVAPDAALETEPVGQYPLCAVAREGTIPASRTALPFQALGRLPLALLSDDFALMRTLHQAFREQGIVPHIVMQSSQWDWLAEMAVLGVGVAVLPEPFVRRLPQKNLQVLPIAEPDLYWHVTYVLRKGDVSHAAQAWLALSRELLPHNE